MLKPTHCAFNFKSLCLRSVDCRVSDFIVNISCHEVTLLGRRRIYLIEYQSIGNVSCKYSCKLQKNQPCEVKFISSPFAMEINYSKEFFVWFFSNIIYIIQIISGHIYYLFIMYLCSPAETVNGVMQSVKFLTCIVTWMHCFMFDEGACPNTYFHSKCGIVFKYQIPFYVSGGGGWLRLDAVLDMCLSN